MTPIAQLIRSQHDRALVSFKGFLNHALTLDEEKFDLPHPGFGIATLREQFYHALNAQRYWFSVLAGQVDASENLDDARPLSKLLSKLDEAKKQLELLLAQHHDLDLLNAREFEVFGGKRRNLVPAHVMIRTLTHLFHHMGQIAAQCRLLDHPVPRGLDYPIIDSVE